MINEFHGLIFLIIKKMKFKISISVKWLNIFKFYIKLSHLNYIAHN